MIVILYQRGCLKIAKKAAADLVKAFTDHVKVALIAANSSSSWPAEVSWDDLLLVMFDGKKFPHRGELFIKNYLLQRASSAILLPVSINPDSRTPPVAAAAIKALHFDRAADEGPSGRLANRVGGMLGLRVQGRDKKIFISYRTTDGKTLATQVEAHLTTLGHRPWLDEAKEIDGETKILPGSPVQKEIDEALGDANLLLLIDTPSAATSPWIKHEVDTADSLLLPILPLCFRNPADPKTGPRFRSLLALQRWVQFRIPSTADDLPLSTSQLDDIVIEIEKYMCEIFKRKCRVPFIVKKEFMSRGFCWKVLDERRLMFESSKSPTWRLQTKVLSHCSIFDTVYGPAMKVFIDFLNGTGRSTHSLFIYDGELLPEPQLREIVEIQDDPVIILHHQEIAALIDSNFTTLGAA